MTYSYHRVDDIALMLQAYFFIFYSCQKYFLSISKVSPKKLEQVDYDLRELITEKKYFNNATYRVRYKNELNDMLKSNVF